MTTRCLICGAEHKNPIRGGIVTRLPYCFKKGHPVRRMHLPPTGNYRNVTAPPKVQAMTRTAGSSRLAKAMKGWGQDNEEEA